MKKSRPAYPAFNALLKNPVHFLAFGLGSGWLRPASGTWGSLLGALLLLPFLSQLFDNWLFSFIFISATFALGCYLCGKTTADLGMHDHGGIVWDEFVGQWAVMLFAPPWLYAHFGFIATSAACLIAFRLFDIWKPQPIRWLDHNTSGGFGIMIDDLIAALYALALLWLTYFFY